MHGPGGGGWSVLSQSEDQNCPRLALIPVRLMSTQVRSPGPDAVGSDPRSDPQIATRAWNRTSKQVEDHT